MAAIYVSTAEQGREGATSHERTPCGTTMSAAGRSRDMRGTHLEQFLTPAEVATRLVVPRKTVLDWLRTGPLKGVKAGRLWRIREPDVLAFLREPVREGAKEDA